MLVAVAVVVVSYVVVVVGQAGCGCGASQSLSRLTFQVWNENNFMDFDMWSPSYGETCLTQPPSMVYFSVTQTYKGI